MADERLTKRERRELRRRERRQQEAEQAARDRRRRILTIVGAVAAVAGIAALFWFTREPPVPEDAIVIQAADAQEAFTAAGCEPVDIPAPSSTEHLSEPAPPADALYPVRPTHSGPHFGLTARVGAHDEYVDERETTHNLEHGSIVVWWDPDEVSETDDTPAAIGEWADTRVRMGFSAAAGQMGSGAGVIAAPFEHGFGDDATVALRGWGVALNCDVWDQTVADAFLASNYGTRGQAPERTIAPYPEDALRLEGTVEQPTGATSPGEATAPGAEATSPGGEATTGAPTAGSSPG